MYLAPWRLVPRIHPCSTQTRVPLVVGWNQHHCPLVRSTPNILRAVLPVLGTWHSTVCVLSWQDLFYSICRKKMLKSSPCVA